MRSLNPSFEPARAAARSCAAVVALALVLVPFAAPASADDEVTVTVDPWGAPTVNTFDPTKPPGTPADPNKEGDLPGPPVDKDGKPLIQPGEAAAAVFTNTYTFKYHYDNNKDGTVTITHVDVTVRGSTTIYDPNDADQQLKDHELGHDTLNAWEYGKDAKTKFTEAAKTVIGHKYPNLDKLKEGVNGALASNGSASLKDQMQTDNDDYDRYSNHGKNDVKDPETKKTIDQETAIAKTEADHSKAPAAGTSPASPDPKKPPASTAPDPANVSFNPATDRLSFGGALAITHAGNPGDPILGRGVFQVGPMVLIGPTGNGAIHLADTTVRIVDSVTGKSLLDGYIDQVAYMPSTLPGFAGMVEGSLVLPPDYIGGVSNTIDSPFLSGLDAARTAGEPTEVWFYANQPLFDSQGNSLTGDSAVDGSLKMGVGALPEPSPLLLAVLAATAGLGYRWGTRQRAAGRRG
jgi:hypothetical protein